MTFPRLEKEKQKQPERPATKGDIIELIEAVALDLLQEMSRHVKYEVDGRMVKLEEQVEVMHEQMTKMDDDVGEIVLAKRAVGAVLAKLVPAR